MRDPYHVLGVTKSATMADIKSAFRKLAKKYHPDQSKDPKAKERFAEVSQAYEIVGDDKKRAAYDRGEIDAEGKPRAPQFEGFSAGPGPGAGAGGFRNFRFDFTNAGFGGAGAGGNSDIFADIFGGPERRRSPTAKRGQDVELTASVSLEHVANGGSVRVTLPSGKMVDITVPIGCEDGKIMRLRGQGEAGGRNGSPGDVLVTLRYAPHPQFKLEGRDLRLTVPITLYDAVLGAKVRVATLKGVVEMNVPAGAGSGRAMRLRGKGLPTAEGTAGDLYVLFTIILPPQEDKALIDLMKTWRDQKPYSAADTA